MKKKVIFPILGAVLFVTGFVMFLKITSFMKQKKETESYDFEEAEVFEEKNEPEASLGKTAFENNADVSSMDFSEFCNSKMLPLGAKVILSENAEVFESPSVESVLSEDFSEGQIVTTEMITSWISFDGNGNEVHWVKIISDDFKEGWVPENQIGLVSENPNPLSMKTKWRFYGSSGAAFSPDGKYVCLKDWGAHNGTTGSLHVLETETGKKILDLPVASDYDSESSEHVVFSKDGNSVFYEQDLELFSVDIKSKKTKSYGKPFGDYGIVSEILINNEGNRLMMVYSSANNRALGSVWTLEKDCFVDNIYTKKEFNDTYKVFKSPHDGADFNPHMAGFSYRYTRIIPEKNLALCVPYCDEDRLSGIYFFELSTGRFIKAENPLKKENLEDTRIDGFEINQDASKIALLASPYLTRVDEGTYYICNLDLSNLSVSVPENSSDEKYKNVKAGMEYLCDDDFTVYGYSNDDFQSLYRIDFNYDNKYTCSYGPNSDSYEGTYRLDYADGKTKISFDPLYAENNNPSSEYLGSDRYSVEKYLCDGYLKPDMADLFSSGGIMYTDDDYLFIKSNKPSEPWKEYVYQNEKVIKYPSGYGEDGMTIYPWENIKMREGPSRDYDEVHMPFRGYIKGEYADIEDRKVVYEGQHFTVYASSVEKEKIDDEDAYWYLVYVTDDEDDEWGGNGRFVWIYGGYVSRYGYDPDGNYYDERK